MKGVAPAEDQIRVLRGICHAFASTSGWDEAIDSTFRWVREALGDAPSIVCLVLPDHAGRLRLAATHGRKVTAGRLRSSRRRRAFTTKRPIRVALRDAAGSALHIYPLVSRGESLGVLEVFAPKIVLEERVEVLEAVVEQTASVLRNAREREDAEAALRGLGAVIGLAAKMLHAECPVRSVRAAADLCHEHLALPVVGWLPAGAVAGGGRGVVVARGFGSARRAEVRRVLEQAAAVPPAEVADALGVALGPVMRTRPTVFRASEAFLAVAGTPNEAGITLLQTVASLLGDSLRTIEAVTKARACTDGLDVGIACTAHEIRGPLLAARAAMDYLISVGRPKGEADLLRHARVELEDLAGLVDPLLRWSTSSRVRKRRADLVKIVREAVEYCVPKDDDQRVVVSAPPALELRVDPKQLRSAVANLVGNALEYSPDSADVAVEVGRTDSTAWVCVRDRGPGVPPEEAGMIFDLFARGSAGAHTRHGKGLGLFITRRTVEAHGGTVRVLPSSRGAAFYIELPVAAEGSAKSAS